MNNRYLAWTLLIAACGLQAYLVMQGSDYFAELETLFLPLRLERFSKYFSKQYTLVPFAMIVIPTVALPFLTTILSWVFLGLKRKSGWNLALGVDLYFALPSFAFVSINFMDNLRYHHFAIQNNPEVFLLFLSFVHILILNSPPIRTLIFARPEPQDSMNDLTFPSPQPGK